MNTTIQRTPERKAPQKRVVSRKSHRVQLELQNRAVEELDELCNQAGFTSRSDAIRYGLRLFKWVIQQMAEGNEILVRKKNSEELRVVEFVMPAQR